MGQFEQDLSKFMKKYGATHRSNSGCFPLNGKQAINRKRKLANGEIRFWIDHPMTWKNGNKIVCHTASFYDMTPNNEYFNRFKDNITYLTNGRYSLELFSANDLNVYFDKEKWGHPFQDMEDNKFRENYLSRCTTFVLVPTSGE